MNNITIKVEAKIDDFTTRWVIGVPKFDEPRELERATTVELWVRSDQFGVPTPQAEVSISSIGTHAPEIAEQRALAYMTAAILAKDLEEMFSNGTGYHTALHTLYDKLEKENVLTEWSKR